MKSVLLVNNKWKTYQAGWWENDEKSDLQQFDALHWVNVMYIE